MGRLADAILEHPVGNAAAVMLGREPG